MRYYPINLNIENKPCLIVGGGEVATRKARTLLKFRARLTVISPEFSDALKQLGDAGKLTLIPKSYAADAMDGMVLVFAATNNGKLNAQVQADAATRKIFCNLADAPTQGDFTLPALVERGDLMLTVSTSGKSPAMSRKLRKELEERYGPEYGESLRILGRIRQKLLNDGYNPDDHRARFRAVLDGGFVELIRAGEVEELSHLISEIFGEAYLSLLPNDGEKRA